MDAIRDGKEILCSGETALLQTKAVQDMRSFQPDAAPFPEKWIKRDEEMDWVPFLNQKLWACYHSLSLPRWDLTAESMAES